MTLSTLSRIFVLAFLLSPPLAHASPVVPLAPEEKARAADAIFRGTVVKQASYHNPADGMVHTRTLLRVDESLKGTLPRVIQVTHPGGALGGFGQSDSSSPQFRIGDECLVFVARKRDGTLSAVQGHAGVTKLRRQGFNTFAATHEELLGRVRAAVNRQGIPGADVTDQGSDSQVEEPEGAPKGSPGGLNGLLVDSIFGNPSRYLAPDRGEPVPYLVDTNFLPAGITPAQALTAVSNAFAAWAAVSSLKFQFLGTQAFPTNAQAVVTNDGVIRIQLHDAFNFILEPGVLGRGGSSFTVGLLPGANWGPGGLVSGMNFNRCLRGFVVLERTNTAMQNLATFTEVLTHEIGHVIGMAHSSEDDNESDPLLEEAIMYFQVHADGRGATLGAYDPPVVRQAYPFNTPPYSFERVMDVVSASAPPNVPGINEIELRGYDLQSGTNVTFALTNEDNFVAGFFTVDGNRLKYTPPNSTSGGRADPAGGSYYSLIYSRFSDGTNASGYTLNRVISLSTDSFPPSDGVPNNWMIHYFGNSNPSTGANHRATNDFDGDGLLNIQEYRSGMSPTNAGSAQRITAFDGAALQWQARPYELYEIQGTTNFVNWHFIRPIMPTNAPLEVRTDLFATNIIATVSNLPAADRMFYRVLKVP